MLLLTVQGWRGPLACEALVQHPPCGTPENGLAAPQRVFGLALALHHVLKLPCCMAVQRLSKAERMPCDWE